VWGMVTEQSGGGKFTEDVRGKIRSMKNSRFGQTRIECMLGSLPYELVLMVSDCVGDKTLMDLIGRWRKKNEQWFLSQFPVSTDRTAKWFLDRVIGAPDRLLFVIRAEGKFIGHVGLFRFDFDRMACELDNIVRGEPEHPGIMGDAIQSLMDWGEETLGLKCYKLKVMSNNERAISFYGRLGFKETDRIPLLQRMGKDGMEWVEVPGDNSPGIERFYAVMELSNMQVKRHNE